MRRKSVLRVIFRQPPFCCCCEECRRVIFDLFLHMFGSSAGKWRLIRDRICGMFHGTERRPQRATDELRFSLIIISLFILFVLALLCGKRC
jgi:hypothetical protein